MIILFLRRPPTHSMSKHVQWVSKIIGSILGFMRSITSISPGATISLAGKWNEMGHFFRNTGKTQSYVYVKS